MRTDLFYLEFDNFTGGLADTYFGVEWNPFKHVGFGLGYNNVTYRVEGDGSDQGRGAATANVSAEAEIRGKGASVIDEPRGWPCRLEPGDSVVHIQPRHLDESGGFPGVDRWTRRP